MPEVDPNKLRLHRKKSDMSQGELASRLGWSQSKLSQYENPTSKERKQIHGKALENLVSILGCNEKDIVVLENPSGYYNDCGIDAALWKRSIQAINDAEEKLGLSLTEDQKLNAALHLYGENIASEKSAISTLKLMVAT